jgi:hypothetical protein
MPFLAPTSRVVVFSALAFVAHSYLLAGDAAQSVPSTPEITRVPEGVILVKGAEPSAAGVSAPLPESGGVARDAYRNAYFGLSFKLPADWIEKYKGPPPSDHGNYVLTQLRPGATFKGPDKGNVLITAQDTFFSLARAKNAREMMTMTRDTLPSYYEVERPPTEVTIAGRAFTRFDYKSPAAQMHWNILATDLRCHVIEFIFTSRDTKLLESLVAGMNSLSLPEAKAAGEDVPICIRDYARGDNLTHSADAVLPPGQFNAIPVRMIIGIDGKVKQVHLISAFPDQAKAITDALFQWRFKPYVQNGKPVEVETGILFGAPRSATNAGSAPQPAAQ